MIETSAAPRDVRLSVAPMMDWTDRHCRRFHRLLSGRALLYTEMVPALALIHGGPDRMLAHDPAEHPLALQLGGSEPAHLAEAVRLARGRGFCEINLNVGCPSDRVKSGCFGAVLMKDPGRVADILRAMLDAADGEAITAKCRIGVDAQDPEEALPRFLDAVLGAGVRSVAVHARKAWLKGLSPKDNRTIPPLDYPLVHRMKARFPELELSINGGIASLEEAADQLRKVDGVMIGRAAYHDPGAILAPADAEIFGAGARTDLATAIRAYLPYVEAQLSQGERLHAMTRHLLGAFAGRPGARAWRRTLSHDALVPGAGPEMVERALDAMPSAQAA